MRHRIAFQAGTLLLRRKQWRAAAFLLSRAIDLVPASWEAHNNLTIALLKLRRWEDAARVAERAIRLNPAAVESHDFLGIALLQLERWDAAVAAYQQVLAVHPARYDWYDRLGMALWRLERWEEVVEAYRAALQLDGGHYAAHNRLGVALLQLGRWDAAATTLRRAIELATNDPAGAAEVAGMRMNLATAEAQRETLAQRKAAFWSDENLLTDVFAVERWLEQLTTVPDQVPPGPRLLFVLDHDFGELTTVKYFVLGQALAGRTTLLLPERLYAHNPDAIPGRTRRYGSVAEILAAVEQERPAIVFLCSGYLLCEHLGFTPGELAHLVDRLRARECRVVTTDPYLGLLSKQDPRTLISFELPREHAMRVVAEKFGATVANDPAIAERVANSRRDAEEKVWTLFTQSERILRDTYHLYPSYCDLAEKRDLAFFNDRLLRPVVSMTAGPAKPYWLFVLASTDTDIQGVFEGVTAFRDLVADRLVETLAAGRHPILIGPPEFLDALRARAPTADGIDLVSHCPFTQFMSLLLSAEQAFYWNAVSHSLLVRLYNQLPIVLFDRGHLIRIAPAVYSRVVDCYYQGWKPPLRDHHESLTLAKVDDWAADYRRQAGRLLERYRRAPSPDQMIAELSASAITPSGPRVREPGQRSTQG